jgi:hypothetical protein
MEDRILRSSTEGRWAVNNSKEGWELASGRTCEVWLGGQWIEGHVEFNRVYGGYFFISHKGGYCGLCQGMRVRALVT